MNKKQQRKLPTYSAFRTDMHQSKSSKPLQRRHHKRKTRRERPFLEYYKACTQSKLHLLGTRHYSRKGMVSNTLMQLHPKYFHNKSFLCHCKRYIRNNFGHWDTRSWYQKGMVLCKQMLHPRSLFRSKTNLAQPSEVQAPQPRARFRTL